MKSKTKKKRLKETRKMNCGEEATIVKCKDSQDVVIKFKKTGELVECKYANFLAGRVKSHFIPSVFGVGITGNEYVRENDGDISESYTLWANMLSRCYNRKLKEINKSYENVIVCKEWLYYANFKKWYKENYYELKDEKVCLDKDILVKDNRVYSPKTAIFAPQYVNNLFIKKTVDGLPFGISFNEETKKYIVKSVQYDTLTEAFKVFKNNKDQYIKETANKYKDKIPKVLYDAMMRYRIELADYQTS